MTDPCTRCGVAPQAEGGLCSWCVDEGEIENRKCGNPRCKVRFMVHVKGGSRLYCGFTCKHRAEEQRRYQRKRGRMFAPISQAPKEPAPAKFAAKVLPKCALCKHGRKSNQSDIGWECQKSAILCRPFGPATMFEKR